MMRRAIWASLVKSSLRFSDSCSARFFVVGEDGYEVDGDFSARDYVKERAEALCSESTS